MERVFGTQAGLSLEKFRELHGGSAGVLGPGHELLVYPSSPQALALSLCCFRTFTAWRGASGYRPAFRASRDPPDRTARVVGLLCRESVQSLATQV